ncbi:MAG: signal peptide peptidase SppA [Opitutaceae bacterium]|nr:signal peptide peptidase SppA [Verrucomicrobiales bacterium]
MPPPPPYYYSQPPRPPGGSKGGVWKFLAITMFVLCGLYIAGSMMFSGPSLQSHGGMSQHKVREMLEVVVKDNDSRNKIAVIDVDGVIMSGVSDRGGRSLVDMIEEQLESAADDKRVKAVVLRVDSPGGEVMASDDIYNLVADFQAKSSKPVVASMGNVAASGGYYVSAPCRWIVANELTITGSIGVIMHGYNFRGLMDKVGIRPEVFKSGKFKDMMSSDKAESEILPEEKKMIQDLIDETFQKFKNVVADGRAFANKSNGKEGRKLVENWQSYADGRIVSGKQAYDLGFVDELGNFETAVERAQTIAGIPDANLIQYQAPFHLGNILRLFGESQARSQTIKIDLGLDFPKLKAGQTYFILPTALPR